MHFRRFLYICYMRQDDRVKSLFDEFVSGSDMRAYDELFHMLCPRLIPFAASIVRSFPLAEEIVSDVFLMLWQKRAELKEVDQPRVYIYVCVRNFSLNKLPGNQRTEIPYEHLDGNALSVMPDIEQRLVSEQVTRIVEKALAGLPPRCRLTFRLVRIDGLSYKETASVLNVSSKTVDAQLAIAIRRLAEALRSSMPAHLLGSFLKV